MSDGMLDGATQIEISPEEVEAARAEEAMRAEVEKLATVLHAREYEYGEVCPRGGSTVVFVPEEKDGRILISAGVAMCSPTDLFSRKSGRLLALDRLVNDPIVLRIDLSSRALIQNSGNGRTELICGSFLSDHIHSTVLQAWLTRKATRLEEERSGSIDFDGSGEDDAADYSNF